MQRLAIAGAAGVVLAGVLFLPDPFGRRSPPAAVPEVREAPPLPDPEPVPRPPPQLAGRVRDVLGRPVARAVVRLFPDRRPPPMGSVYRRWLGAAHPSPPLKEAVTDRAGRFVLRAPPPGSYRVETRARGYRTDVLRGIHLTPDAPGGELEIYLEPGVTVRGRVYSEYGQVVADALVYAVGTDAAGETFAAAAVTDREGRYQLAGLPVGCKWWVSVRHPQWVPVAAELGTLPAELPDFVLFRGESYRVRVVAADTLAPLRAQVLVRGFPGEVAAGATGPDGVFPFRGVPGWKVVVYARADGYVPVARSDLVLPRGGGELPALALPRSAPLWGEVVDGVSGRAVAGAQVFFDPTTTSGLFAPWTALSDRNGLFALRGYDGLGGRLWAARPGYRIPAVLHLRGWPRGNLRLEVLPTAVVTGRVWDGRGKGVAGATVELFTDAGEVLAGETDAEGRYRLEGAPRAEPLRLLAAHPQEGHLLSQHFRIPRGVAQLARDLVLPGAGTLVGEVRASGLGPVAAARVEVYAALVPPVPLARVYTDRDGRFQVGGLGPAPVRVVVRAPGFLPAVEGASPAAPVAVQLRRPRVLAGVVLDAARRPVAGVLVTAEPEGEAGFAGASLTDLDGRFRVAGLAPGRYALTALSPDGREQCAFGVPGVPVRILLAGR